MAGRIRVDEIASALNDAPQAPFGIRFPNLDKTGTTILDWYEEGLFTPIIVGGTTAGVGTYTYQNGMYTRIGNVVNVSLRVEVSAHTGTGSIKFSLPFIPKATSSGSHAFILPCNVSNLTFSGYVNGYTAIDGTAYALLLGNSSGSSYTTISMDTSFIITMSGMYLAA